MDTKSLLFKFKICDDGKWIWVLSNGIIVVFDREDAIFVCNEANIAVELIVIFWPTFKWILRAVLIAVNVSFTCFSITLAYSLKIVIMIIGYSLNWTY